MLKVQKTLEPKFYKDFKTKHISKINNWDDMNDHYEVKQELREYMLLEEQNFKCPYCESLIYDESEGNIEHIRPKDKFKELYLDYNNFLTSCRSAYSCDNFKGSKWDENFINPVLENPRDYFTYDLYSGEIIPKSDDKMIKEKAEKTIEILNLNHNNLKNKRRNFIKMLSKLKREDFEFIEEQESLLKYYLELELL
ncbi:MAG: retron system putative HNH endonuclease [Cetobacterium sp.]|uniref:retron system putative HNH endonuclease n=1 Tax=Cetobacterium sp. TaxID=2071632 RepID=UPI003F2A65C4